MRNNWILLKVADSEHEFLTSSSGDSDTIDLLCSKCQGSNHPQTIMRHDHWQCFLLAVPNIEMGCSQ